MQWCLQAASLASFLGRGHVSETYMIGEAAVERSGGRAGVGDQPASLWPTGWPARPGVV